MIGSISQQSNYYQNIFGRFRILLIILSFSSHSLADVNKKPKPIEQHKFQFVAFNSKIEIMIPNSKLIDAQAAFKEIKQELLYLDKTTNPWKPSALVRLNKLLPSTVWFSMAPSLRPILIRSIELSKLSNHLFNPAMGKLTKVWGFHQKPNLAKQVPSEKLINALVKNDPKISDIVFQGIRVKSNNSQVQIDFQHIVKGYAANLAIRILQRRRFKNAIINMQGNVKSIGSRGNRPWRIPILIPTMKSGSLATVLLSGEEAVFRKVDNEHFFSHGNKRYHPIIDPRSGYPGNKTRSVTVIHKDAALAEAAATALFIAGPIEWPLIATRMRLRSVLLSDKSGKLYMTPDMYNRLTLDIKQKLKIQIIPVK